MRLGRSGHKVEESSRRLPVYIVRYIDFEFIYPSPFQVVSSDQHRRLHVDDSPDGQAGSGQVRPEKKITDGFIEPPWLLENYGCWFPSSYRPSIDRNCCCAQ